MEQVYISKDKLVIFFKVKLVTNIRVFFSEVTIEKDNSSRHIFQKYHGKGINICLDKRTHE
jgi:hypothetical protein